jgi:hypothetical protein
VSEPKGLSKILAGGDRREPPVLHYTFSRPVGSPELSNVPLQHYQRAEAAAQRAR